MRDERSQKCNCCPPWTGGISDAIPFFMAKPFYERVQQL